MKSNEEQLFFGQVWEFWMPTGNETPPCLVCYQEAVTLHEIEPRSTNPDWMDQPFNSVPICARCHDEVQIDPTSSGIKLRALAIDRAHAIMDWKGEDYDRVIRKFYKNKE